MLLWGRDADRVGVDDGRGQGVGHTSPQARTRLAGSSPLPPLPHRAPLSPRTSPLSRTTPLPSPHRARPPPTVPASSLRVPSRRHAFRAARCTPGGLSVGSWRAPWRPGHAPRHTPRHAHHNAPPGRPALVGRPHCVAPPPPHPAAPRRRSRAARRAPRRRLSPRNSESRVRPGAYCRGRVRPGLLLKGSMPSRGVGEVGGWGGGGLVV